MSFYESIFVYGSPIVATLACLLNLPEIVFLVKRYQRISKAHCERRTVPVILLASLAASDFFVGFTVILIKILRLLVIKEILPANYTTERAHKVLNFLFLRLSLLTSVFSLLALTIDRFLAVGRPIVYRTRIRAKHGIITVIVTWLSSSLIIGLHYYFSIYGDIEELKYRLLIFPITIIPACIAFTVLYLMILRRISIEGRETMRRSANKAKSYQRYILERELKVSHFAAIVVCVFMICWLPLGITGLIILWGVKFDESLPNMMFFLAFVNSIIDPLIYFAFKEGFSELFKKFLSTCRRNSDGLLCRRHETNTNSTL